METQLDTPPPSGSSSAAAAAYPRWVMLERDCTVNVVGDATTLAAAAHTVGGSRIQVSLRLAEPPAVSCVCVQAQIRDPIVEPKPTLVAAHGDSLLIQVAYDGQPTTDHFVYNAGDAAVDPPRPPSLSLLPPCFYNDEEKEIIGFPGPLNANATAFLRRGDDELVVAELCTSSTVLATNDDRQPVHLAAELFMLRSGEWTWGVKRPLISISSGGEAYELPSSLLCEPVVVPVGHGRLCWVDRSSSCRGGVVLCDDVFEDSPTLRYVPLPVYPCGPPPPQCTRTVCATVGGGALKFVNMYTRFCCGAAGAATSCERSRNAYVIRTWTLRLDATELWSLDAYRGLPRVVPESPVVSFEEPGVVFFCLREDRHGGGGGTVRGKPSHEWRPRRRHDGRGADAEPTTVWKVMVNTRRKTIHPVLRNENGCSRMEHDLVLSNVSWFLNSACYRKKKNDDDGSDGNNQRSKKRPRLMHIERAPPVVAVVDDPEQLMARDGGDAAGNSTAQPSSEMFEALQEIPSYGLGPADEVRAYRILISSDGDGRRLTSLSRLPKKLRKDWLLMEIKASQA